MNEEKAQFIAAPRISIVVPIFNTEKYLDRCIESITEQTEEKIEIILVNDGSTDSSGSICDAWAQKDKRIRVIHKSNEGVTIARKAGVDNASGEWICFADSDDELPEKSMQLLFAHARDDIDIVIGAVKFTGSYKLPYDYSRYEEKNTLQYIKSLMKWKIHGGPVARLFRKTLFDSFVFDMPADITRGEDFIMNIRIGQKARRIVLLPDIVYHYIQRHPVTTNKMYNYERIVLQSILPENRNALRNTVILYRFLYRYSRLKSCIKLIVKNFRHNEKEIA